MTFLNPIYLWSLLGIILPIAIHLWSRRKVITIKIGSTKLLQESEPRQTSTLRPNELWLLFLRILTILLLTLLLSEPQLKNKIAHSSLLYVIEPSLIASPKMEPLLDGIPKETIRVMTKEFPELADYDETTTENSIPNYWQLAQELNALPADSIVVFTKGFISGVKGRRPIISNHINWLVLNSDEKSDQLVEVKKKGDSLELFTVFSDADKLQFEKKKWPKNSLEVEYNSTRDSIRVNERAIPLRSEEPINILLVHTDGLVGEMQYIGAAYRAIAKFLQRPITIETTTNSDTIHHESYDTSIWLGVEPRKSFKKTRLIFKPDPLATKLIVPSSTKNEYFLTHSLNSENIVSKHLSEKLLELLELREDLKRKIQSYDKRVLPVGELRPVTPEKPLTSQQARLVDISPWLWALLILILVTERIIAKYRKQ